ncbi:MAG: thioredoxin domain-containing protein, partial [Candidatus Thorarchaeota archaeon]
MTPDKKPFFAGTYISKKMRYGRPGMIELISQIDEIWRTNQKNIDDVTKRVLDALSTSGRSQEKHKLGIDDLQKAFSQLSQSFDERRGGFGITPKFPSPHNMLFLMRYWKRASDDWSLFMVEKTLQEMRKGGIFDHVGYGFHRYSTDAEWLVPHFEKMLYDQAMLLMAYTETYQITRKQEYANTADDIFEYITRDMTSPEGGFFSAEDADSDNEEGKFYLWKKDEIEKILDKKDAEHFMKAFNVRDEGNYLDESTRKKTGKNILHTSGSPNETASLLEISNYEFDDILQRTRKILLATRNERNRPLKDTKILTDWNGLMIAALAKAARVFNKPEYLNAAERASEFLMEYMINNSIEISHRFKDGAVAIPGFIDDYAFAIWAFLEMYETTFEPKYLERALGLANATVEKFWDAENHGFFFSSNEAEELLVRHKEGYDGAIPSGNSVMSLNLLRLSKITANIELEELSEKTIDTFSAMITKRPSSSTMMLSTLDFTVGPSCEIIIAGKQQIEIESMLAAIHKIYHPNKIVIVRGTSEQISSMNTLAPYTKQYTEVNNRAAAYVCTAHNCKLPTTDPKQMLHYINGT